MLYGDDSGIVINEAKKSKLRNLPRVRISNGAVCARLPKFALVILSL